MVFVLADRVKETSLTSGSGTLSLAGAEAGFQSFVSGVGDGNTCYYCIDHEAANQWEIGIGTVTDGVPDTLSRDTVLSSSNSGAKVSFAANAKDVFVCHPAGRTIVQDDNGRTQIGDGTNYTEFLADGELRSLGTAKVEREFLIDMKSVNRSHPTNPAESNEDDFTTIDFDDSTEESIYFDIHSPSDLAPGEDASLDVGFFVDDVDDAAQRAVVWSVEYKVVQNGQVLDFDTGTSTTTLVVEIPTITADKGMFFVGVSLDASDLPGVGLLLMRLYRNVDHVDDDHNGDARLKTMSLHYISDRLGVA